MSSVFMGIFVPMGNLILDHCGVRLLVLSFSITLQSFAVF